MMEEIHCLLGFGWRHAPRIPRVIYYFNTSNPDMSFEGCVSWVLDCTYKTDLEEVVFIFTLCTRLRVKNR